MSLAVLNQLPGFRRRLRITPESGRVCCEVEDDYHCMRVNLEHDGVTARRVDADMRRAPWTTCPGAEAELQATFTGVPLAAFASRGSKKSNCTHLYDLAELAAAHAADGGVTIYDIRVADPVNGERRAEICRDGEEVLSWTERKFELIAPAELAGKSLFDLRDWLAAQTDELCEAAKLLRWGTILANGRQIPLAEQSDAKKMPPNCYTFQPERAAVAERVGEIRDFSEGPGQPLEGYRAFA